jgi:hypothetical protein
MKVRQKPTEQGRTQQHASDHLTDDLRLPEPAADETDEPARCEDDRHLKEERDGQLRGGHWPSPVIGSF